MSAGYYLTGIKEIDSILIGLPLQVDHKVLQAANYEAAKLVVNAAKGLAPEGPTGNLVDSIGTIKPSFSASEFIGETHTGPRRGRFKGYAGHFPEYGTKKRNYRGANRGVMPIDKYMEPAFEKTKNPVQLIITESIGKKLYAFMRRIIRK